METLTLNRTNGQHRILLIGPDSSHQDYLHTLLEAKGFRILRAQTASEAGQKLNLVAPDLLLADLGEADLENPAPGLSQLLRPGRAASPLAPLVVLNSLDHWGPGAETLKRAGAEFLAKPVLADDLLALLGQLLERSKPPAAPAPDPSGAPRGGLPADLIIGASPAIRKVLEQVRLVAPKSTTVLITGETGTGKERISRAIHSLSGQRRSPMISVNCGGIPATLLEDEFFGHVKGAFTDAHQARVGRFEQANHSTIFLDEIADLPLELQPKLLRVLQEREIHRVGGVESLQLDLRVIAATNVDLWSRVHEGGFREDLYYRINVFPIHLPPLRERREDIPLFLDHFLERFCRRDKLAPKRLPPAAEAELMSRSWPGNIRELENAVEIAVIRSQDRIAVDVTDFPPPRRQALEPASLAPARVAAAGTFKDLVNQFERDLICGVLDRTQGNKSQAAQILRLKRTTLLEKLKKLGAAHPDPRV
jgi:DNA-binding NtrC family response regulator